MLRVLPDSAHEVPVILLVSFQGKTYLVGSIQENLHFPPDVMVRLGSKVSDGHPSSVGFRVFLRSDVPKTSGRQSLEDHYHVVSCKYVPHGNTLSFKATTAQDIHELVAASPFSTTLAKMELPVEQSLWRVDVETSDTNAIIISYHGPHLHTNNDHIKKVAKLLPSVSYAKSVSIFFPAHRILVHHLEEAIKSGWVGMPTPSWKDCLPENALPKWPLNIQTTMVAGSTDLLNVLVTALHEGKVSDGPGTSLHSRPESKKFEDFVQATYPSIKRSPKDKVYPVFLNVADAVCLELPFGASMFNQANTYAAFYAIHELLQVGIPASEIGIITLYPSQAQIYGRMMLECHDYNTERGYNKIKYGLLEEWVGKTIGVAIVDFVRTSNASGNLGLLSQARRLKVSF